MQEAQHETERLAKEEEEKKNKKEKDAALEKSLYTYDQAGNIMFVKKVQRFGVTDQVSNYSIKSAL